MEINFERTVDDYIDFNLYHLSHSPSERRQMRSWRLALSVIAAALVLALALPVARTLAVLWLGIGMALLAAVLTYLFAAPTTRKSVSGRLQKMLKEGDNRGLFGPQTIMFSAEGISARNETGDARFHWSAVKKVVETEKHFFLYTSAINALVIPRRCLATTDEEKRFRSMLEEYRPAS